MEKSESYAHKIPNDYEFRKIRDTWRSSLGSSKNLRQKAVDLTIAANEHSYGYHWEWCGVPIIRHPDDIVLQQEIVWALKPSHIIETGVARGGSLSLSATLMEMTGNKSKVLGIDIQILDHAIESLRLWTIDGRVKLVECDSTSTIAASSTKEFIADSRGPILLVLDSNHSHDHVLGELNTLAPLLSIGSIIMVADTIIEEMPGDYYPNRPWGRGNNPLSAVNEFLRTNQDFKLDERWTRRSLMGECRDGILIRTTLSPK